MPNSNIVSERILQGKCPICIKEIGTDFQIIEDKKYGKIWICKHHYVDQGEKNADKRN